MFRTELSDASNGNGLQLIMHSPQLLPNRLGSQEPKLFRLRSLMNEKAE